MRTFDYSPFYRATVGFDRVFDLLNSVASQSGTNGYPPYNIEKSGDNAYKIVMAVAGFGDAAVEILPLVLAVLRGLAGDQELVLLLGHVQLGFGEARHRHHDLVGVVARLLDVVRRVTVAA